MPPPKCSGERDSKAEFQCRFIRLELHYIPLTQPFSMMEIWFVKTPLNRAKQAGRARTITVLSFGFFVLAAVLTLLQGLGFFLALAFVVIGGSLMLIGSMIREHSGSQKPSVKEDTVFHELVAEEEM